MAKTFVNLNDTVATWRTQHNDVVNLVGDLATLTTTADSDLVGAINELQGFRSGLDSDVGTRTSLTTTDKTSLVAAINEIDSDLGTISSLSTTDKASLVAAVNELQGRIIDVYNSSGTLLNT
jgi:hypothetical protein